MGNPDYWNNLDEDGLPEYADDFICCLCGKTSDNGSYGHNPHPLPAAFTTIADLDMAGEESGHRPIPYRCCDSCNWTRVIPARLSGEPLAAFQVVASSEDEEC